MIKGSSLKIENPSKQNYRCPSVAVDIIIQCLKPSGELGYVLIERKNPPFGIAIPGGFVDYGEALYDAAIREAKEETSLDIGLASQFFAYSKPDRDPRQHVISVVFNASAEGEPKAADDAKSIVWVRETELDDWLEENKDKLVCDHYHVLKDFAELWGSGKLMDPRVEEKR